jgi:hypothetical protein
MITFEFWDARDINARCLCASRLTQADIDITPSGQQPECRTCRGDDVLGACRDCGEWVHESEGGTRSWAGDWWHARCMDQEAAS